MNSSTAQKKSQTAYTQNTEHTRTRMHAPCYSTKNRGFHSLFIFHSRDLLPVKIIRNKSLKCAYILCQIALSACVCVCLYLYGVHVFAVDIICTLGIWQQWRAMAPKDFQTVWQTFLRFVALNPYLPLWIHYYGPLFYFIHSSPLPSTPIALSCHTFFTSI